ncbi:MAG: hypothetical protein ACRDV3_09120 [Acidothermaceae bacterium]
MYPYYLTEVAAAHREELLRDARRWHHAKRHGRRQALLWLLSHHRRTTELPVAAKTATQPSMLNGLPTTRA